MHVGESEENKSGPYLFVYGLLMEGFNYDIHEVIKLNCSVLGRAFVKGQLYDLGGYPGLVPDDRKMVSGQLLEIESQASMVLQLLDDFEGITGGLEDEYVRRKINTYGSSSHEAWIYEYVQPVDHLVPIPHENYKDYLKETGRKLWQAG